MINQTASEQKWGRRNANRLMERADHIQNGLVGVYREMDGTRKNEETHKEIKKKKRAGPQALCLSQCLLCCYLRLSLLRTTTRRRKKKNKIEEREGKKESVSRRRYEVEGVGMRERERERRKRVTICSRKSHPVTFGRGGISGEKSGRMRDAESFLPMCLKRPTNAQQLPIKRKMTTHGVRACVCVRANSSQLLRASCCCTWWTIEVRRQRADDCDVDPNIFSLSSSSFLSTWTLSVGTFSSLYTHTQSLLVNREREHWLGV